MKKVQNHYNKFAEKEWERLARHRIEFDITCRYLEKYLPDDQKILDLGGGPGRYSLWLAEKGHEVTLVDLSEENIKLARKKAKLRGVELKAALQGNALELSEVVEEEDFDVILNMGPMYHLLEENNRYSVMEQCMEKLKEGGILVVAFISAYAPLVYLLKKTPEKIIECRERYLNFLIDGKCRLKPEEEGFTDAYFYHPREAKEFMAEFNLDELVMAGAEGLAAPREEEINSLSEEAYNEWLEVVFQTSQDPVTWGICEHLLYLGRKRS